MSSMDRKAPWPRFLASFILILLVNVVAPAPRARAYESIRRDSPLGIHLAEVARQTGMPLEIMLGPHAWRPRFVEADTSRRSARRAAAAAQLQSQLDAATGEPAAIVFAVPKQLASPPPIPPAPVLPGAITTKLRSFALGDLDGDGLPDVVGAEVADSVLDVWRNLGDGTYAPAIHYPLANRATKVVLGDFNGDGHPDVAIANIAWGYSLLTERQYSVLLNNGDGTFGARFDGNLSNQPSDIFVADFGHDGRADLVFQGNPYAPTGVEVVRSRPDGSFSPAEDLVLDPADHHYEMGVVIGDLDSDGNPDILLSYSLGDCLDKKCSRLGVFYGRADGTFESGLQYHASSEGGDPSGMALLDVDGDHNLDVSIALGSGSGAYSVLIRNGGGRSLEAPSVRPVHKAPYVLAAGKFRTGYPPDLVASGGSTVSLLRNRGDGTFMEEVPLTPGELLDVTDLNGDGLSDVLVANGGGIEVRLANGSGGFADPVLVTGVSYVTVADFTGDHRPDLAGLLPNGNIGILPGDGSGGFGAAQDFGPAAGMAWPMLAGDLDGDGIADLAWASRGKCYGCEDGDDSLHVRWGTGSGFTDPFVFDLGPSTGGSSPVDLETGDFNGDGLPDVALIKGQLSQVSYVCMVRGLGHRAFSVPGPDLGAGWEAYAGAVADFDGDGLDDFAVLVTNTNWYGSFCVLRGRPDGTLENQGGCALEYRPCSIAVGDFRPDGRIDVVAGCISDPGYYPSSGDIFSVANISPVPPTTPTLASLVRVVASSDHVDLLWDLGDSRAVTPTVERREPSSDWTTLAAVTPDGTGLARYSDSTVVAGARYAYRLRLGSQALGTATAETWVDIPASLPFALRPNPARGSVEFTLPANAGSGRLEVIDLQGRVRWRRAVSAGETSARWNGETADGPLPTGLYWTRLVTPGYERTHRLVWMR